MSDSELANLEKLAHALTAETRNRANRRKLATYQPYTKQLEFHQRGLTHRERLLRAGNQLGKTLAGGAEAAYHLTGDYPEWWVGRRWDRPVTAWVGGPTGETTRDNAQRMLCGRPGEIGTGMIPGDAILTVVAARGVADLIDYVKIKHKSGGESMVKFKTYDQGRIKWQGDTLDFVWFDEEPPQEIYTEGLTRTNATGGFVWLTFTPLLGMSEVVRRFLLEQSPDRSDTNMTIEDAEHIPAEERQRIIDSYPAHEREARTKGVPIMGSGLIFPIPDSDIECEPFDIPKQFYQIGCCDFGWDHPFAAARLAHDRDHDVVYVAQSYRVRQQTPLVHAGALRAWGDWLPWAWPRDGRRETLEGAGVSLAKQYRGHGLKMLEEHAQFEDGSVSVESGLMDMLTRMQTGRFKVFRNLREVFEEKSMYHREDGLVVKEMDDLLSAIRYGCMSLRFARQKPNTNAWAQPNTKWVV